jgi:hypothetical protein
MFVASEWASNQFLHIALRQRPAFDDELKRHWPAARPEDRQQLVEAIGFEGDCWLDTFPVVPVVWLDEGSRVDPSEYASRTLADWDGFLKTYPPNKDWTDLIDCLGHAADDLDQKVKASRRHDRDVKFASRVMNEIGLAGEDFDRDTYDADRKTRVRWAIIIVGKNHAYSDAGTMRWLLEQAGHHCYEMPGQL